MTQLSLLDGLNRRERGMQRAARAASPQWQAAALLVVERWARTGRSFSVDELRAEFPNIPHYNAVGAIMAQAQRQGMIRRIGWQKSIRPEAHARVVPVYMGLLQQG